MPSTAADLPLSLRSGKRDQIASRIAEIISGMGSDREPRLTIIGARLEPAIAPPLYGEPNYVRVFPGCQDSIFEWPGAPSFSRTSRKGPALSEAGGVGFHGHLAHGFSQPHDLPFSSHFSSTALTDTKSQSRKNSPTVQHRKQCPSPETDPNPPQKPFSAASLTTCRQAVKAVNPHPAKCTPNHRNTS
jgi:hypothetical protein